MRPQLKKLAIATTSTVMILAGMSAPYALAATDTAPGQSMSRKVAALADSKQADKVDVIVVYKKQPGRSEKNRVKALGGKLKRSFGRLKMRTMSVSPKRLKALANNPNIELIALDTPVMAHSPAAKKTANLPDQAVANGIYKGTGVTVAVLDSGVAEHPELLVQNRLDCTAGASQTFRDEFNSPAFGGQHAAYDLA